MALAVFDIDGTLVSGPTTEKRLFLHLLRRGWLGPGQLAAFCHFALEHAPALGRDVMKKNKAYLAGLRTDDLEAQVSDWVRQESSRWWFAPCVARLRRHQMAGDEVVLLSGTLQATADAVARELGVRRAIGTQCAVLAGRFLRDPPVRHPYGADKRALVAALVAEFRMPAAEVHAYADSAQDLPMLRSVGHPVAVRPDGGLRAAAVAAGWEILGER